MCQRCSQELTDLIRSIAMMSIVLLSVAATATAQGGDGRSTNFRPQRPITKSSKPRITKAAYQKAAYQPKTVVPQDGRLSIVVNEAASRVYLTSAEKAT